MRAMPPGISPVRAEPNQAVPKEREGGSMSEFKVMSLEDIQKQAERHNCEVLIARANELQFDLDSPEAIERFEAFYGLKLSSRFSGTLLPREEWASKSGNRHVVVTLPMDFDVPERIAMQTAGGSDFGREFAALCCHWDGSPHPVLLFKPCPPKPAAVSDSKGAY
jgi:hypothetical protein